MLHVYRIRRGPEIQIQMTAMDTYYKVDIFIIKTLPKHVVERSLSFKIDNKVMVDTERREAKPTQIKVYGIGKFAGVLTEE